MRKTVKRDSRDKKSNEKEAEEHEEVYSVRHTAVCKALPVYDKPYCDTVSCSTNINNDNQTMCIYA